MNKQRKPTLTVPERPQRRDRRPLTVSVRKNNGTPLKPVHRPVQGETVAVGGRL